MEQRAKKSWLR
jgi:hypothetical protein